MQNITLNQLALLFKSFADRHPLINSYYFGPINLLDTNEREYPLLAVIPSNINITSNPNQSRGISFYFDILFLDTTSSTIEIDTEVLSDMLSIAQDFIIELDKFDWYQTNNLYNNEVITLNPVFEKFSDVVTGYRLNLNISTDFKLVSCNTLQEDKPDTEILC